MLGAVDDELAMDASKEALSACLTGKLESGERLQREDRPAGHTD